MNANVTPTTDKFGDTWWLHSVDGVAIRASDAKTLDFEEWLEDYSPLREG